MTIAARKHGVFHFAVDSSVTIADLSLHESFSKPSQLILLQGPSDPNKL